MLALTSDAADAIREIVDSAPGDAEERGLRISAEGVDGPAPQLSLSIADGPEASDETVAEHGATVYVAETASELLSDKVLDAHAHEDQVHFTIMEQD